MSIWGPHAIRQDDHPRPWGHDDTGRIPTDGPRRDEYRTNMGRARATALARRAASTAPRGGCSRNDRRTSRGAVAVPEVDEPVAVGSHWHSEHAGWDARAGSRTK